MNRIILTILLSIFTSAVLADAPLQPPKFYRICNDEISYCASISPEKGSIIYRIEGTGFDANEVYRVPGWHRYAYLSSNGIFFIVGYSGHSLVPLNADENTVILTIWKRGEKSFEIKLGQILASIKSLERTSSHYYWGEIQGFFFDGSFKLKTVEGKKFFNKS